MEFSKTQVASLVLGYLKEERCFSAYAKFLKGSPHLYNNTKSRNGKYFPTRVLGMSLTDYLEEYALIYTIVQGRLEATNYFKKKRPTMTLIEQLSYLLDSNSHLLESSSPIYSPSELETTPSHTLPGNTDECESGIENNLRKKPSKPSRTKDAQHLEEDLNESIAQTLLDKTELLEKLAETINNVRNTSEMVKNNEEVGAGASKELDAIIKTVVQRTEEDPLYNSLLDEIIGTDAVQKRPHPVENRRPRSIDDHNNDAVRSIIAASHTSDAPSDTPSPTTQPTVISQTTITQTKTELSNEIYMFDGNLESYLKTTEGGAPVAPISAPITTPVNAPVPPPTAPIVNPNPLYIPGPGLLLLPPYEDPTKQFYVVNNQQVVNLQRPAVLSNNDIMQMPTVIVNEPVPTTAIGPNSLEPNHQLEPVDNSHQVLQEPALEIEVPENRVYESQSGNDLLMVNKNKKGMKRKKDETVQPDSGGKGDSTYVPPRHVRNLDFTSPVPNHRGEPNRELRRSRRFPEAPQKNPWDAQLRNLCTTNVPKFLTNKKRTGKKTETDDKDNIKKDKSDSDCKSAEELELIVEEREDDDIKTNESDMEIEEERKVVPSTPLKGGIPKGLGPKDNLTPFSQVLEEQLRGIDLSLMPTPNIPITPGFSMTPAEPDVAYNKRGTDYSTSSSYYMPSDSEQNKSLEQIVEESNRGSQKSPIKILSQIVVSKAKIEEKPPRAETKKAPSNETLKKFNRNVIGKKNLSLIRTRSSSSDDSDMTESSTEMSEETNITIIQKGGATSTSTTCADTGTSVSTTCTSNSTIVTTTTTTTTASTAKVVEKTNDTTVINDIINKIEVKQTLVEKESTAPNIVIDETKQLLDNLEKVRKRTVNKIKTATEPTKRKGRPKKSPKPKQPRKNRSKKKDDDEKVTSENTNLWDTLHLIPKTPAKPTRRGPGPRKNAKQDYKKLAGLSKKGASPKQEAKKPSIRSRKSASPSKRMKNVLNTSTKDKSEMLKREETPTRSSPRLAITSEGSKKEQTPTRSSPRLANTFEGSKKELHTPPSTKTVTDTTTDPQTPVGAQIPPQNEPLKTPIQFTDSAPQTYVKFDEFSTGVFEIVQESVGTEKRPSDSYNFDCLASGFSASIFSEELNTEIFRTMRWTSLESLVDLAPKINILSPRRVKRTVILTQNSVEDDDLMDFAVAGSLSEANSISKTPKKRKLKQNEDGKGPNDGKHTEKRAKNDKNDNKQLLIKIGMEEFLDKVHKV